MMSMIFMRNSFVVKDCGWILVNIETMTKTTVNRTIYTAFKQKINTEFIFKYNNEKEKNEIIKKLAID